MWLESLAEVPMVPEKVPAFDFATVVAQFTALRHDVNLQTKATRAATEQTAKVLETVSATTTDDSLRPSIKSLLDVTDALTVSLAQVEKLRNSVEPLLAELVTEPLPEPPSISASGFLAKLFGAADTTTIANWVSDVKARDDARVNASSQAGETLMNALASAVDGYAMSLRRVERALLVFGLEAIECLGRPFDAETMEVVELGGDGSAGQVTREVRRGYTWKGQVFRCAQVRVADQRV
ncbi:hypothetical protein BH11PLA2_BH11PLA2_08070 [soil metagenome]